LLEADETIAVGGAAAAEAAVVVAATAAIATADATAGDTPARADQYEYTNHLPAQRALTGGRCRHRGGTRPVGDDGSAPESSHTFGTIKINLRCSKIYLIIIYNQSQHDINTRVVAEAATHAGAL
jgi:hypothetical protein